MIHSVYNQPEPLSLQSSLILPRCTHFGIIVAFNNRQGLPWWCRGWEGFPGSSASKESACNAGDPSSIPGLERSPGEGIGDSLQYSWASLVAQMVKNLPAMQETWVQSLGWEDPLEEGKATHSSILPRRISMDRGAWRATVHGVTTEQLSTAQHSVHCVYVSVCFVSS